MKLEQKSINNHIRFLYSKDTGNKYSKISSYIYQKTRRHNPEHRNQNVSHTWFLVEEIVVLIVETIEIRMTRYRTA